MIDFESIRNFFSQVGLWIGLAILSFALLNERANRKLLVKELENLKDLYREIMRELIKKK
jgi:hypothetical protein